MDKPKTSAKDFFLWAGAMVAFYWSTIAYIFLVFEYINYAFPNPLTYYPANPYQSGISGQMASIIVLLPVYLFLMQLIRRDMTADASRKEIWVRRWALILTLFVAGIAIAVDLILLLTTFLNGEALTAAFLLKIAVILLVAGGVFIHFISDLRGYWDAHPSRRRYVIGGVAVLAIVTIFSGFFIVGTPGQARLARFDELKVNELQNIQSQVIYYWQAKRELPAELADLASSNAYGQMPSIPADPQTGAAYGYEVTGPLSFKLCAEFNTQSRSAYAEPARTMPIKGPQYMGTPIDASNYNWQHGAGQVCFDRAIDPSFYPPLNKN